MIFSVQFREISKKSFAKFRRNFENIIKISQNTKVIFVAKFCIQPNPEHYSIGIKKKMCSRSGTETLRK
jgi:hypothetical protein